MKKILPVYFRFLTSSPATPNWKYSKETTLLDLVFSNSSTIYNRNFLIHFALWISTKIISLLLKLMELSVQLCLLLILLASRTWKIPSCQLFKFFRNKFDLILKYFYDEKREETMSIIWLLMNVNSKHSRDLNRKVDKALRS